MKYGIRALLDMMTYRRGMGSEGERMFIDKYLSHMPGMEMDRQGNWLLTVGQSPKTLFSCHVDTAHSTNEKEPIQTVSINMTRTTAYKKDGRPLGADNAVGIWIMLNMIHAQVPGLYIFHYGEERGGVGSSFIASETPEVLKNISRAIAFDRRGLSDVITHQSGIRCCSDLFADTLAAKLGLKYRADDTGSFTDTANYTHLIPECTNISAGYYDEHTGRETLDLGHAEYLCNRAIKLRWESLPTKRMPVDPYEYRPTEYRYLADLVADHPEAIAAMLEELGYGFKDIHEYLQSVYGDVA